MAYLTVVDGGATVDGVNDGMGGFYYELPVSASAQVGDVIIIWGYYTSSGGSTPSDNFMQPFTGLTVFNWYEYTAGSGTWVEEGSLYGTVDDSNIPIGGTVRLYSDVAGVVTAEGTFGVLILRPQSGYSFSSVQYAGPFVINNGDFQSQGSYTGVSGTASIDVPDIDITMAVNHNLLRLYSGFASNLFHTPSPVFSQNSQDTYNESLLDMTPHTNNGFAYSANGDVWGWVGYRNTGDDVTESFSRTSFTVTGARLNVPTYYVDLFEEGLDIVLTANEPTPADVVLPKLPASRKVYVKELPYDISTNMLRRR